MRRFFPIIVLLLFLSSCTTEIDQMMNGSRAEAQGPKVVFQASTEGPSAPETKVYADENMKVLWNEGDQITIFNKNTLNTQWGFTGEDGDTAGGFEEIQSGGFFTGNPVDYVYAAYPYSKSTKLSNSGVFTMVLPAEQSYKEHSFGIGANTMVAITDGSFLAFKNVGGYLSLRLYGDNISVSRITIKGNNGEKIAGKASIDIPFGGTPTVTMAGTATEEVSIVCDPAVKIGADADNYTAFWFVIPPVTFEQGFTITVTDDRGGVFEKSTSKSFCVTRNTLDWMSALKVVPNYDNVIIQFADANFKAYCVENFDTNKDGEISGAEAEQVTDITVCTDNIKSLGGIEFFTNLKTLSCTGSLIGTKSTTGAYAGQLESINIGQNILLEELDCHGNQLDSLDVSNNPNLNTVICTDNPIEVINLAPGQIIATLEAPEDSGIVYDWEDIIGPMSFPDANFRAFVFTNYDTDGNGIFSPGECAAVTIMSVCTENIISLKGIEFFSNLTELYCYGSITDNGELINGALETLDVSNNQALVILYCHNNQLKTLDVSNCLALEILECYGNQLTSLDISSNIALKWLYCWSNQLTELDVSHNASLENLMCQGNLFTSLDLTGADALSCLICHENRLTNLTFSQNRSLHTLVCYDNELSSLDVSNNVGLEDLECNNNQLTELDVSNNAFLTFLDCTNNPSLTTIYIATGQTIESLAKPESAQLVEIGSRNASFSRTILQYLLENYDADGNFILSQTEIDNVTGLEIEPAINNNSAKGIELLPHLQSLSCTVADFGVESEMTMLDVSHNPELKSLFIYRVAIESLDLSNNPLLETIGLQMVPLNELDVSNNPALTTLNFRSMHLDLDVSSNLQLKTIGFHEGSIGCLYLAKGQSVGCRHLDTYIFPSELILYDTVMYKGAMPAAFPDASFRSYVFGTFDLDGNGILSQTECDAVTEINVYTDNIASLTGIESFANLTRLTCKGSSETTGQLVSLDVSNLPSLAYLDCANNPLKTILARPGHTIQTICKPDDAVILSDLEKVLDNLLTATNNFLASCEAASQQASLSSSDALSIYNAMLDFAYAREPLRLYFNDVSGHDYFSYLLNNSMDYGSYNFAPLPYSLIDFDVLVNNSYQGGELIGNPAGIQYWNNRNSLQNIATQLFNSTIGSIFGLVISVGTGSVQAIPDIEAALNAENYKAFYGVCKYDANTASIISLN